METRIILTITHKNPIPDLTDKVANRIWSLQGVEGADAALDDLVKFLDEEPKLEQPSEGQQALEKAQGESRTLYECAGCGHLHGERVSSCDCLENPAATYNIWVAHPQATEPAPSTAGELTADAIAELIVKHKLMDQAWPTQKMLTEFALAAAHGITQP